MDGKRKTNIEVVRSSRGKATEKGHQEPNPFGPLLTKAIDSSMVGQEAGRISGTDEWQL